MQSTNSIALSQSRRQRSLTRSMIIGWLLLIVADLMILTRGFPGLCSLVRAWPVRRVFLLSSDLTPGDVVDALQRAHGLAFHQYQCLKYSAAATWLLRLHGHSASLIVGVKHRPFRAHAWCECADVEMAALSDDESGWTMLMRL